MSPLASVATKLVGLLADAIARPAIDRRALNRSDATLASFKSVCRGGAVSVSSVFGGTIEPMPSMEFDRGPIPHRVAP